MVMIPEHGYLKKQISGKLQPIMEGWSGVDHLTMTAMYGIRIYTSGAQLQSHVDTMRTHVISGIINVAQNDMAEDWPLKISDHEGTPHNITMKPGDLVLYESASCIHGRPYVMAGKEYANFFTHFKPVDESLWSLS